MDPKLASMPVRLLLGLLKLSGPQVDASWTHSFSIQYLYGFFTTSNVTPLPTHPCTNLPPIPPTW